MTPRKDTADLIEWAEARGWTFDGIRGNGHPALRWTDGTLYTLASTAGDWRNTRNAKAELARIDGQPLPDRKSTRLNSSHGEQSRMPSSA